MLRVATLVLCLATPAFAQHDDTAVRLDVCRGMRSIFIGDSETLQTMLRQDSVMISDLQKKLAEAEARVPPYPIDPNISD